MKFPLFSFTLALLVILGCELEFVSAVKQTVFIISNAETPSLNRPGLTPIGVQRAEQCIPNIFKDMGIGVILSCTVDPDGEEGLNCPAAMETATPIANFLGLNITTCGTGEESDDDCVGDTLRAFAKTSSAPALVVWDNEDMDDLLENLDVDFPDDDDDTCSRDDDDDDDDSLGTHPDVILTAMKSTIVSQTSMNCSGIDGPAVWSVSVPVSSSEDSESASASTLALASASTSTSVSASATSVSAVVSASVVVSASAVEEETSAPASEPTLSSARRRHIRRFRK